MALQIQQMQMPYNRCRRQSRQMQVQTDVFINAPQCPESAIQQVANKPPGYHCCRHTAQKPGMFTNYQKDSTNKCALQVELYQAASNEM